MKILGIGPSMFHDPAAALLIDGKIMAAAEEERFTRKKHASGNLPHQAIKFCLDFAGIKAKELDLIAFPWSPLAYHRLKFPYFKRKFFSSPRAAIRSLTAAGKICEEKEKIVREVFRHLGIDYSSKKAVYVEHHLAHAASAYYLSGFKDAAILSIDGGGEFSATLLARGRGKEITKIAELCVPDSLGLFYSAFTEYLGFKRNNGEYKLMGMAPYGEASRVNFEGILSWNDRKKIYRCNDRYFREKRRRRSATGKLYSKLLTKRFGPPRKGEDLSEPYIHIAAAVQKKFEEIVLKLVEAHLKDDLISHGNLCFAGGCALNVALNRVLLEQPYIKNLWVQPAAHDAGASLGAALYVAAQAGEKIEAMTDAYLGPEYSREEIENEIKKSNLPFSYEKDISRKAAELLSQGEIVGWFQGRMEWGPRALGNRSILGNPTIKGTADKINAIIKFREKWRPFCPAILKEFAREILDTEHSAPFMTIAFKVNPRWKDKIPEVVHVDGTCRPQVVDKETNPRFYEVIENFSRMTRIPLVINTSLNRRDEPLVCTPQDALAMFLGCGLKYLAMGDYLVRKR